MILTVKGITHSVIGTNQTFVLAYAQNSTVALPTWNDAVQGITSKPAKPKAASGSLFGPSEIRNLAEILFRIKWVTRPESKMCWRLRFSSGFHGRCSFGN